MNVSKLMRFTRESRIESLLSWPPSVLLTSPWIRRILCALAVVSSWVFMIAISPFKIKAFEALLVPATLIMLVSLLLLRRSVRRVTSLPEEHLDELEIANRDWAFRMGYLVVRRIGLFVSLALIGLLLAAWFPVGSKSIFEADWGIYAGEDPSTNVFVFAADSIRQYFASEPVTAAAKLMGLLTYVAYSFPIILLAWRSSSAPAEPVNMASWPEDFARYSRSYFKRLFSFGVVFGVFWLLVALRSEWVIFSLFVAIAVGLYVFFWGLAIQIEMLMKLRTIRSSAKAARLFVRLRWFVVVTTLVAIPIPSLFTFSNGLNLRAYVYLPLILGLILVVLHSTSYAGTLSASREPAKEKA